MHLAHAEVTEDRGAIIAHEHVGELHVTVEDIMCVHVDKGLQHLPEHRADLHLRPQDAWRSRGWRADCRGRKGGAKEPELEVALRVEWGLDVG